MKKNIALTIAGSDPSGGAGIQADLKAFTSLGLHGATVITCITAQNTQRVKSIHKLPVEVIENQIETIMEDMQPDIAKTGMLYDEDIVNVVSEKIKRYNLKTVVDPIMVSTSGDSLSNIYFVETLKSKLIPIAYMMTPNIPEANALTGRKIDDISSVKKACKEIYDLGAKYVLIKGGHLKGKNADDVLFDGKEYSIFSLPRIPDKLAHGSGCTLSALITGYLALDEKPTEGIRKAKHILWNMIEEGYKPGKEADVLNFSQNITTDIPAYFLTNEHFVTWFELKKAVDELLTFLPRDFVPEVGINFGYSITNAKKIEDVCAINGRITKTRYNPIRCGGIDFGVSKHVASVILAAMRFDHKTRCAINIRYSKDILEKCKRLEFKISTFDRLNEPRNVKSTMEWGTAKAIKEFRSVPDIIYDSGGEGKEPMIRILGKNPKDVLTKARVLVK
jgi:hydroxymethylpyrimidine kinase/phosphomethylpyrimidine kinase